eukprot:CAMPEP_0118944108 /NCGR_PEP_ID=MMETSP1169-20130426/39662_1 /TAXON_ID=36882 /ORGANISM="Pyramimonas obovata, Strain CCMP722" /LENGTH=148 /DNA_ID=CAMNT_0006889523 /DNA_START=157 /DNA_END=600 /DNA_ORIENTATION=+
MIYCKGATRGGLWDDELCAYCDGSLDAWPSQARTVVPKNDFSHYEEPPAYTSSSQYIPSAQGPRRTNPPGQLASASASQEPPPRQQAPQPNNKSWEEEEDRRREDEDIQRAVQRSIQEEKTRREREARQEAQQREALKNSLADQGPRN